MRKHDLSTYSVEQLRQIVERVDDDTLAERPLHETDEASWQTMPLPVSPGKTSVHLRVDSDVLQWFRSHGKGHLTRMNAVLRTYMEANRRRTR